MRLKGKTIIVTGASSGIGAASALLFAAEGASVVLGARREDRLRGLCEQIRETGGQADCLAGDVREESYAEALVALAEERFGGLDGALNNAGMMGETVAAQEMSAANWREVIETNLTSAFFSAKYQVRAMERGESGSIVFTSSFVGHRIGFPGMAAYAASKAGLVGLTQVLAAELGPKGIRVNALLPGGTATEMAGDDSERLEFVRGLHALKRMAEPEEIAGAALFLLSNDASFVTGSALLADGGNSINKT